MSTGFQTDRDNTFSTAVHVPLQRNRDYLLIVAAGAVSSLGSKLSQTAAPFLMLGLTHSPMWAGLLGAAQLLPYLFFSLPAGAWVDRLNRKRLLVACDLLRGSLLATIPLAYLLNALTMLHLFSVVFVVGICRVFFEVADVAALPQVVQECQLARARSVSEGIEATATVVGPSLAGVIVGLGRSTVSGSILAYLVDSISYLASAIALLTVRRPLHRAQTAPELSLIQAMHEGLRFLWGHVTLRLLMLLTTAVNFLQAPIALLVVLIAQERFGLTPAQIGLLLGTAGGAAVLGSLLAAWWYRSHRLRYILIGSLIIWAMAAFTIGWAQDPFMLALGMALIHLVWPPYAVAVVSYRLAQTPAHLQGRVISSFRMLSYGAEPLGLALGGLAVSATNPTLMLCLIGIGLLSCVGVVMQKGSAISSSANTPGRSPSKQ